MARNVQITDDSLAVDLEDGRTLLVPLAWYPRLVRGSAAEREHWELIGRGEGIRWPDLDEDISIANLLDGKRSGESHRSFARWLEDRTTPR